MHRQDRDDDDAVRRGRRAIDDPFFSRGNRIAFAYEGAIFYIEEREGNHDAVMHDNTNIDDEQERDDAATRYPCSVAGCAHMASTLKESEEHFETHHMYQCGVCHVVMPCNHLLDLHVQETHDSYFASAVERHESLYQCLVHACPSRFSADKERLWHLQQQHGYPKWFRFHPSMELSSSERQTWLRHHNKKASLPKGAKKKDALPSMQVDNDDYEEKRAARREKQKKKRSKITCRYYATKEGCFHGNKCMFLHSSVTDMSDLVSELERKAKVSVPAEISFGRRRKGPY